MWSHCWLLDLLTICGFCIISSFLQGALNLEHAPEEPQSFRWPPNIVGSSQPLVTAFILLRHVLTHHHCLQIRGQILEARRWLQQHELLLAARNPSPGSVQSRPVHHPARAAPQQQQQQSFSKQTPPMVTAQGSPARQRQSEAVGASGTVKNPSLPPGRSPQVLHSTQEVAPIAARSQGSRPLPAAATATARSPSPAAAHGHRDLNRPSVLPPPPPPAATDPVPAGGPPRVSPPAGLPRAPVPQLTPSGGHQPHPSGQQQPLAPPDLPSWLLANLPGVSQPGNVPIATSATLAPASSAAAQPHQAHGQRQSRPPTSVAASRPPASTAGSNPFAAAGPWPQQMSMLPADSPVGPRPDLARPAENLASFHSHGSMAQRPAQATSTLANPFLAPKPSLQPAGPSRVSLLSCGADHGHSMLASNIKPLLCPYLQSDLGSAHLPLWLLLASCTTLRACSNDLRHGSLWHGCQDT